MDLLKFSPYSLLLLLFIPRIRFHFIAVLLLDTLTTYES